jgi:hypothetical protein
VKRLAPDITTVFSVFDATAFPDVLGQAWFILKMEEYRSLFGCAIRLFQHRLIETIFSVADNFKLGSPLVMLAVTPAE